MTTVPRPLVNRRLSLEEAADVVRRRSLSSRLRGRLGDHDPAEPVGTAYWPIAIVEATARSTGRRRWTERVRGAVDLVSGRIGLVDEDVPVLECVQVEEAAVVPARLGRDVALDAWHTYFRDYVDRRRKPMSPPALSVDSVQRLWLEHLILADRDRQFLVDPVTHRADPIESFPWVIQAREAARTNQPATG
jgi:hypothetical protein